MPDADDLDWLADVLTDLKDPLLLLMAQSVVDTYWASAEAQVIRLEGVPAC